MDTIQPDGGDEGCDIICKELSRIGPGRLVAFATLADIDVVVTDSGIEPADLEALRRHDVEVVIA